MAEKKTWSMLHAEEILTNNAALHHYAQCKDCMFRDKRIIGGAEYGWDKCVCRMYGRTVAAQTNRTNPDFYPYTPVEPASKPNGVYDNTAPCTYYEPEPSV